jgi:hypothetical protein
LRTTGNVSSHVSSSARPHPVTEVSSEEYRLYRSKRSRYLYA